MRSKSEVVVAKPPAEVFPWLLDADKVPQWMSGIKVYKPLAAGPLKVGSKIRQELSVSGQQLKFDLEVVELDAPRKAKLKFEGSGFAATSEYSLAADGDATKVTWVLEGKPTSFKTKLLASMVEAKLQEKNDGDLARLRDKLAG